jgi:glycosyltransferase involved in cell wall biosynthesis
MDRIYLNLLKLQSQDHDITLLSIVRKGDEYKYLNELNQYCKSVILVHMPNLKSFAHRVLYKIYLNILSLMTGIPICVFYNTIALCDIAKKLTQECDFDIIEIHHSTCAALINQIQARISILFMYGLQYEIFQRQALNTHFLKRLFLIYQARKMKKYEEKVIRGFNAILATQEAEKDIICNLLPSNQYYVDIRPNIVDTEYFYPFYREPSYKQMIFVGAMTYYPNVEAMLYFCNEILPLIRTSLPDIKLLIIGKDPPRSILRLGDDPQIKVIGYVPDVRPYIAESCVYISPLLSGSGIKVKIMEALAMGKAIVATPIAVEGIGVKNGQHVLIASNPEEFANCVVMLFKDPQLRRMLEINARQFAEESFSPEAGAKRLRRIYESVITKNQR